MDNRDKYPRILPIEPIKPIFDCEDFDIIENDECGDYGFSQCYEKEGDVDVTMFKHRLNVRKDDYKAAVSDLTENSGVYETCKTPADAIRAHMKYWCHTLSPDEIKLLENAPCFPISNSDMTILLRTGFDGPRLLCAQRARTIRRKMKREKTRTNKS